MKRIRQENDPRYVNSEGIQLPAILKMCGLLGNKLLHKIVGEPNLGER